MSIKPENKKKYPRNWKQIVEALRRRSGDRCELCAAPDGIHIDRSRYSADWEFPMHSMSLVPFGKR